MAYYVTRDDEHMVKFCVFLFFCTSYVPVYIVFLLINEYKDTYTSYSSCFNK